MIQNSNHCSLTAELLLAVPAHRQADNAVSINMGGVVKAISYLKLTGSRIRGAHS